MKRFFGFVIFLGFVIMIGAAGGYDVNNAGFVTALLLEVFGMALAFFGMSALLHYKKYLRRSIRRACNNSNAASKKISSRPRVVPAAKEVC